MKISYVGYVEVRESDCNLERDTEVLGEIEFTTSGHPKCINCF